MESWFARAFGSPVRGSVNSFRDDSLTASLIRVKSSVRRLPLATCDSQRRENAHTTHFPNGKLFVVLMLCDGIPEQREVLQILEALQGDKGRE